jgi:hypothetical protein
MAEPQLSLYPIYLTICAGSRLGDGVAPALVLHRHADIEWYYSTIRWVYKDCASAEIVSQTLEAKLAHCI